ncbi:ATP-binding cassette domain-containing protein [Streptomyces cinnabarinus]|uniref:ATP-binding cassette domain-containing protein n=1 Tax=Streptomyces cinnabarinus TaxID=67287 RepID=A0ABY7K7U9_9ACTN|nr:ATP-binding cassette domain-containing protein [Streptomyces cinnabarinus]WAZ19623.1 ATP-binding cassette domain-containing protein [Streptomyces cinnabarinus]
MRIIEVRELRKEYRVPEKDPGLAGTLRSLVRPRHRTKVALDGVGFAVEAGESVGYLGSNGAGKSTTIKILTGVMSPTGGRVRVNGLEPHRDRKRHVRELGAVFGHRTGLWWDLPVRDSFRALAALYEIPRPLYRANLEVFTELLELQDILPVPVRQLSLGQRMRADLAGALLHNPRLVFLDEPTAGLDLNSKAAVRQFVRHLNQQQSMTVFLTSHDMADIEGICDRLIILDRGRKILDDGIDRVRHRLTTSRQLIVTVPEAADVDDVVRTVHDGTAASCTVLGRRRVRCEFDRASVAVPDLVGVIMRHHEIVDFELREPALEDIVQRIFQWGSV